MTRKTFFFGFAAGIVGLALACSDNDDGSSSGGNSSDGTSGGTSNSSAFKNCSITSGTSCSEAELKPYSDCIMDKCDSSYKQCYGDGYKSGSFGGPCGSWMACVQKCDCKDTQCILRCPLDEACQTCVEGITSCDDSCTQPECAKNPTTPDSGSTGNATCADLQQCCASLQDAEQKSGCEQAAASGDDATCSTIYNTFKAANFCN